MSACVCVYACMHACVCVHVSKWFYRPGLLQQQWQTSTHAVMLHELGLLQQQWQASSPLSCPFLVNVSCSGSRQASRGPPCARLPSASASRQLLLLLLLCAAPRCSLGYRGAKREACWGWRQQSSRAARVQGCWAGMCCPLAVTVRVPEAQLALAGSFDREKLDFVSS